MINKYKIIILKLALAALKASDIKVNRQGDTNVYAITNTKDILLGYFEVDKQFQQFLDDRDNLSLTIADASILKFFKSGILTPTPPGAFDKIEYAAEKVASLSQEQAHEFELKVSIKNKVQLTHDKSAAGTDLHRQTREYFKRWLEGQKTPYTITPDKAK